MLSADAGCESQLTAQSDVLSDEATSSPADQASPPADSPPEPVPVETLSPEALAPEALAPEIAAPELQDPELPDSELQDPGLQDEDEVPDEPAEAVPALPQFASLGLSDPILRAVAEKGYLTPTPIQLQAIPVVLMGRDVLGCAQTGTGKTAGFTLPMLDILAGSRARARMPRSLILEPTRELALQVAENFVEYGKYLKLNHALIIGGESMSDQKDTLMRGVDVLIATPGRLIDMFDRGGILLTDCRVLVIDEADRMLDMGFIPDVERIVAMLPQNRQTLFFSATMAPEIRRLADVFLQNPKEITVTKPASVATTITSRLALVAETDKREALRRLIRSEDVQNALIFCNRKRDVDILFKSLTRHGFSVGALHGDMTQSMRFATLEKFKANELRLLACSDVAARGIDIGGLSHVFNFDVPHHAEDYVHRIGRTGRAGREGRAFTLATPDDRLVVEAIEKLIGAPIPRMQVEGLDPVTWAEGAGRGRRRGRGGAKPAAAPPPRAPQPPRAADRPAPRPPRPSVAQPIEPRAPEPRIADPRAADRGRERPPRPPRDIPIRERASEGLRDDPRRRGRDDDLGPSVLGFGEDIPAFMLLPKRGHRPVIDEVETPGEATDQDILMEVGT
jgi:superfamily II DNA/RNA helicase